MSMLTKEFVSKYKNKQPNWGFNGLGYIVYKRTYARLKEDGNTEEWYETVERCINGAQKIGAGYTSEEAERIYDYVFNLKCNFAGRMLWQLGTSTVDRFGANSLLNCFEFSTEILTSNGIKQIGELSGKSVTLMTEYGKWVESKVEAFGQQEIVKLTLQRGPNIFKEILTTKNHRWFRHARRHGDERKLNGKVESFTSELESGDYLVSTFGQSIKSISDVSRFGIIHGLVFGDGSVCNNVGQLTLCGDKNKELLKYFPDNKLYYLGNEHICVANLPKYFKAKPALDMDKSYLYGWLAGYFAADGHITKDGNIKISSSSRENLEFVRDVCTKLGIAYCPIISQLRIGIGETEESELFSIGLHGDFLTEDFFLLSHHKNRFINKNYEEIYKWKVVSVEYTGRVETVYCAIVPDTHSFVIEGNILTGNCWAVAMREPNAFLFLFENLMLGGGVGYSIRREDVHELPKIKKGVKVIHEGSKDADYIVPDKREGWVNLLSKVLDAFYVTGKSFSYSTILIRGYGEPIKGFGGKASGPQVLIDGIDKITKLFQSREGKKLRSIDVLDICNIIGSVVVAGNVRRSAEIALGDPDDILYLRAKNWGTGNVPNWRAMSNNTIYADSYDHVLEEIWKNGYEINPDSGYANGEPYGFFNLPLSQKFGRIKDGPISDNAMYPTSADDCEMTNPCAEISLSNYECCNLCELYLNNITSKEELIDCSTLLYKTQKAIASLPFIHEQTNKIVHKNMRLGLGVTGVCQSLDKLAWLDDCYVALRNFDRTWSKQRGWPESIKLTTIKPSGTLSLLGGATPGVHPAFSEYYMRTVRMSSSDGLVQICKDMGYHVEFLVNFDGTENRDTVVVYFPCKTPEGSILAKDMDVLKQLDMVKKLQTDWSDNAVSVTAYYKPEELDSLKTWLKDNYENNVKSVSFLLFKNHGFKQAPYQEIDEETYLSAISKVKSLSSMTINSSEMLDMAECSSGACPIR